MRSYWAIALVLTYNNLFGSLITWPSASSRIGQDIYKACDSDLYIAEFLHPEHAYNCISTSVRMYSSAPVNPGDPSSSGTEDVSMCSDQALVICLCGQGLGHCPSDYRVARYYVCSNPFEFPDTEPVAEAYDGPYARFISSVGAYDCSKPSNQTKADSSHGDSYSDGKTQSPAGGSGSGASDGSGSGGTGSGGTGSGGTGSGGTGSGGTGSGGTGSGGTGSGDSGSGGTSIDPADYECAQSPGGSIDSSSAYQACSDSLSGVYSAPNGTHIWCGSGSLNIDGSGGSSTCDTYGSGSCCGTAYYEGCSCSVVSGVDAYYAYCSSYSGCGLPGQKVPCYHSLGKFPYGVTVQCSLSIPKPDGSGDWTDSWTVPEAEGCQNSCDSHRQKYSDEFPSGSGGGSGGPEDPEDYEDCETTDGCDWVGAPMGYGVCHCDDTDSGSGSGDKGTGPTSRDGRSNGQNGTGTECGKGANGTNCEDTQKKVLNTVSELNESVEDFSDWLKKEPSSADLKSLSSQFQSDVDSDSFSNAIFQDSNFQVWKQKLTDQIQRIKTESASLTNSVIPAPPSSSGNYGCLEFNFFSSHFGPLCLSTYLEPLIPQINSFLQFFKYFIGFLVLFRK